MLKLSVTHLYYNIFYQRHPAASCGAATQLCMWKGTLCMTAQIGSICIFTHGK